MMNKALVFAVMTASLAGVAQAEYAVGATPPDFTCNTTRPDLHGTSWNLFENRGKVVMINFGAVWCGPCNSEFPYLQSEYEVNYDPAGFELVHIDVDNEPADYLNNHWIGNYGITFPLLMGCGSLFGAYGTGYIPHTLILDTEGIVRGNWVGFATADIPVIQGIIESYMSLDFPALAIEEIELSGDANGDGRPDPGETVSMGLSLSNSGIAVEALTTTATLSTTSAGITINTNQITFPAVAPGETEIGDLDFSFTVAEGVDPMWADFTITVSSTYEGASEPYVADLTTQVRIGRPALLVVDSDGGADDNENWVTAALNARGEGYDILSGDVAEATSDELNRYSRVIWLGGSNTTDLSGVEAFALADFLNNGGELIFSSQHALNNSENTQFFSDYFHVGLEQSMGVTAFLLQGVAEDPYFSNSNMVITGSGGAANNTSPDRLTVMEGATPFMSWMQGGGTGGVYVDNGTYKAIFTGFPIEAARVHSSYPNSMTMAAFLDRADNFFTGTVGVNDRPAVETGFEISKAYPNPFNPSTTVSFSTPRASEASVIVYNTLGQQVAELFSGNLSAGTHDVVLDGSQLSSGIYFVQLVADNQVRDLVKVSLVK